MEKQLTPLRGTKGDKVLEQININRKTTHTPTGDESHFSGLRFFNQKIKQLTPLRGTKVCNYACYRHFFQNNSHPYGGRKAYHLPYPIQKFLKNNSHPYGGRKILLAWYYHCDEEKQLTPLRGTKVWTLPAPSQSTEKQLTPLRGTKGTQSLKRRVKAVLKQLTPLRGTKVKPFTQFLYA